MRSGALTPSIFNPWRRTICYSPAEGKTCPGQFNIAGNDFVFVVIGVEHPCKLLEVERDAVRFMSKRCISEHCGIEQQFFENAHFFIVKAFAVKGSEVLLHISCRKGVRLRFLFRFFKNTVYAGIGILNIIYRVLRGLGLGDLYVHFKMAVGTTRQEQELGCVGPDIVYDLPQGNEFTGAF